MKGKEMFHKVINNLDTKIKGQKVLVAVSGGMDSVCLLHVFRRIANSRNLELGAAHVNHGLRGEESNKDAEFVHSLADGLDFHQLTLSPGYLTKNIECKAREERYKFFRYLSDTHNYNWIAVAHNANDQAETILMNMTRGAGINGLSGISPENGNVLRPLLHISRQEISDYAYKYNLIWRDDKSNDSDMYKRNRIRHNIIPILTKENPKLLEALTKTSLNLQESSEALEEAANFLLEKSCRFENGQCEISLDQFTFGRGLKKEIFRLCIKRMFGNTQGMFSTCWNSFVAISESSKDIKCEIRGISVMKTAHTLTLQNSKQNN